MIRQMRFVALWGLIFPLWAYAQDVRKDFRLRTGVQANIDMPRGFSASVQYQYRAEDNITAFDGSFFTGSVQYTLIRKKLFAEAEYRFSTNRQRDLHRIGGGLSYRWQKGRFTLSNRLLWQQRYRYFARAYEPGHSPFAYLRYRLQLKYRLNNQVSIYTSAEPFYKIAYDGNELRRIRYTAGCNLKLYKGHQLDIFYFIQPDYNNVPLDRSFTLGVMYEFDLLRKSGKKKKEADWF